MSFLTFIALMVTMGITGLLVGEARAGIVEEAVEYEENGTTLEGFAAYDSRLSALRPGIIIVHDWMGLGEFAKAKASELAKAGYVAFAADIYGKGIRPADRTEAAQIAAHYKDNRNLLRARARAAYDTLAALPGVDRKKIVIMGYCFGGTTALELARSGAPLAGTVSFHGGLSTPNIDDARNITSPVLVLHGADDPLVPPNEVQAFKTEMAQAGVDMTFFAYPGAVHSFTNPDAGNNPSNGAAYNAQADKASWQAFMDFLKKSL